MRKPKFSVVVPLYNKCHYIARAIQSVLDQTYDNFELIVVDDGSTDGSAEIVKRFGDSRIRMLEQANSGASGARNSGIKCSRGEWIAFLDADDIWMPENLSSHVEILKQHPEINWSAGSFVRRYPGGRVEYPVMPASLAERIDDGVFRNALSLISNALICTCTVVIRKEVFSTIGYFDPEFETAEDLDMWMRLWMKYRDVGYADKVIMEYMQEIPYSLTETRIESNDNRVSHALFVRKYWKAAVTMDLADRLEIAKMCKALLRHGIMKLILGGQRSRALDTIAEFRRVIGGSLTCRLLILAMVPKKITWGIYKFVAKQSA